MVVLQEGKAINVSEDGVGQIVPLSSVHPFNFLLYPPFDSVCFLSLVNTQTGTVRKAGHRSDNSGGVGRMSSLSSRSRLSWSVGALIAVLGMWQSRFAYAVTEPEAEPLKTMAVEVMNGMFTGSSSKFDRDVGIAYRYCETLPPVVDSPVAKSTSLPTDVLQSLELVVHNHHNDLVVNNHHGGSILYFRVLEGMVSLITMNGTEGLEDMVKELNGKKVLKQQFARVKSKTSMIAVGTVVVRMKSKNPNFVNTHLYKFVKQLLEFEDMKGTNDRLPQNIVNINTLLLKADHHHTPAVEDSNTLTGAEQVMYEMLWGKAKFTDFPWKDDYVCATISHTEGKGSPVVDWTSLQWDVLWSIRKVLHNYDPAAAGGILYYRKLGEMVVLITVEAEKERLDEEALVRELGTVDGASLLKQQVARIRVNKNGGGMMVFARINLKERKKEVKFVIVKKLYEFVKKLNNPPNHLPTSNLVNIDTLPMLLN